MPVDLLTPTLAVEALRECLCHEGQIKPTKHFRDALADEGDVTIPDVWHVLRTGRVFEPAEPDIKTGEWKYKIEGQTPEREWIAVIFCPKSADRINLVTIFRIEGGKGQ